MNPQPLRERILGALELAPMTDYDLARCLGQSRVHHVCAVRQSLLEAGAIRIAGYGKKRSRAGRYPHTYARNARGEEIGKRGDRNV